MDWEQLKPNELRIFRGRYNRALRQQVSEFEYGGETILVSYAKYIFELPQVIRKLKMK